MIDSVRKIHFAGADLPGFTRMKNKIKSVRSGKSEASLLCCSAGKWQQCDVARLLDRQTEAALMRRAYARQTTRHNFAAFGDKLGQQANVFVVDRVDFLDTEFANFLATEKFPSAGSAFTSTGAGWTPLSAV
jgi:hypothetical protein